MVNSITENLIRGFGMKRILLLLFLLQLELFFYYRAFSFNHTLSRSYHHTFTKTTDLGKENIEDPFLNDEFNSEEITEKYGKKNRTK